MSLICWLRKMVSKSSSKAARLETRPLQSRWRRYRPALENLENRLAPAVTSSFAGGLLTLTYDGTSNTDALTVMSTASSILTGNVFQVTASPTTTLDGTLANSETFGSPANSVNAIDVVGNLAGNALAVTFDTNSVAMAMTGAITVTDIETVIVTDNSALQTGTLQVASFAESGGMLAATTLGRPLTATGAAGVSATGDDAIAVNNTLTTMAGSGGPVTLSATAQATSTLTMGAGGTITADGAVSLTANTAVALNAITGASLIVNAGGAITQTAALTVGGTSSFISRATPITLTTPTNAFTGAVSLSNSGANDVSLANSGPLVVGTTTVGQNLTLTAGGSISEMGALTVPGTTTLAVTAAGSDILLASQANDLTGPVTFAGTLANIRDVALRNIDAAAAVPTNLASLTNLRNLTLIFDNTAIALPALTLNSGGNLTVSAGGAITQTGALTVPGTSSFSAGANPITLTLANAFTGAVSLSNSGANDVSLTNSGALVLGTSTVGGNLTVSAGGAIKQTGILTVAGTSSFSAGANPITLTLANAFTGAVSLSNSGANDVSLTNSGALVLGTSTIGRNLTVIAGGAITQTGPLTVPGTSSFITNTNDQPITLANAGNAFTGAVSFITQTTGGNTGNITINNGTTDLDLGASTVAGSFTSTTTGAISVTGTVNAGGNAVNLTASTSIGQTAAGVITGGQLTTSSGSGTVLSTAANAVSGFNASDSSSTGVSLNDTTLLLTITGISETGSGSVTVTNSVGITTNTAPISTSSGAIGLNASGGTLTIGAAVTSGSTVGLSAGGDILVNASVSGSSINATAGGAITESGAGEFSTSGTLTTSSGNGTTLGGANLMSIFNATDNSSTGVSLTNSAAPLTITGISEAGSGPVTVTNSGGITTNTAPISASSGAIGLSASGGTLTIGAAVTAGSTVGLTATGAILANAGISGSSINATAGGAITESGAGEFSTSGTLTTSSGNGTTLGGPNLVSTFKATDSSSTGVSLANTANPLTITGISETSTGPITVTNTGALITSTAAISTASGAVGLTASGNVTIGASVVAGGTGTVTINGNGAIAINAPVTSSGSSVLIQGGAGNDTITINAVITGRPINILGGAGNDTITVNVTGPTAATNTLNLDGQAGSNTYVINLVTSATQQVVSPVNINNTGKGSSDVDSGFINATSANNTLLVVNNQVTSTFAGTTQTVNYAGLDNLTVNTGSGNDTISIQSTLAPTPPTSPNGTPVTIKGGAGNDSYTVSSAVKKLDQIKALVSINAGTGVNRLLVDESGSTTGDVVYLTNALIFSNAVGGFKPVSYRAAPGGSFSSVTLLTGSGNDVVNVQGTSSQAANTIVNTGAGNDFFLVSSDPGGNGTLAGVRSPLALDAGTGVNGIEFSEAGATARDVVFLTASRVTSGLGTFAPISYQASGGTFGAGVALFTGSGNDAVNVQSTRADATTIVNTGAGNDFMLVSSDPNGDGNLAGIAGPLVLDGGSGNNQLEVSEAASTTPDTVFVTSSLIYSNDVGGFKAISYQATGGTFGGGVSLFTGSGNDAVIVQSTLAGATTFVNTGGGNDFVLVSSDPGGNGTLKGINGYLDIDEGAGNNRLEVSEAASTAGDTVFMTNSLIYSNAVGGFKAISYQATGGTFAGGVALFTGSGNNAVNVQSDRADATTLVSSAGGNDLVIVSSNPFGSGTLAGIAGELVLDTGAGTTTLLVSDEADTGATAYTTLTNSAIERPDGVAPILYGTSGTFANVELLMGQGDDTINVQSTLAVAAETTVQTGDGNDNITVSSTPDGTGGVLGNIDGPLAIRTGSGGNHLVVSEAGSTTADNVSFTASSIVSTLATPAFAPITYAGSFLPTGLASLDSTDPTEHGIYLMLGQINNTLTFGTVVSGTFTNGMSASSSVYVDMGPSNDTATVNVSNTSNYQGLTVNGDAGLNILQVFDITGGATAATVVGGSKLHPQALGTITVSYPNGSSSVINTENFQTRQVFSGGKEIA